MDITPVISQGLQIVESYGGGGFTISGVYYAHSVLIAGGVTQHWRVTHAHELVVDDFLSVEKVEILLLGTGGQQQAIPIVIRQSLRARGIIAEVMDTGAACRTYNILLAEGRKVAAALIAV